MGDVEGRIKDFEIACQGKKQLETYADSLRKELAKVEEKWVALVDKAVANLPEPSAVSPGPCSGNGKVAPVQVLGEEWHCATLQLEEDSGDEWYLGPLRSEAAKAAEDLRVMSNACAKSPCKPKIKRS